MDYNKTVLKRWSRTILSICSTLLNIPLKLKGRRTEPHRSFFLLYNGIFSAEKCRFCTALKLKVSVCRKSAD